MDRYVEILRQELERCECSVNMLLSSKFVYSYWVRRSANYCNQRSYKEDSKRRLVS